MPKYIEADMVEHLPDHQSYLQTLCRVEETAR